MFLVSLSRFGLSRIGLRAGLCAASAVIQRKRYSLDTCRCGRSKSSRLAHFTSYLASFGPGPIARKRDVGHGVALKSTHGQKRAAACGSSLLPLACDILE